MRAILIAISLCALSACSGNTGLAPGLTARMDAPGAQLDRGEALNIVNQFRTSRTAAPLAADPALDARAQQLAATYAQSGTHPSKPDDVSAMRLSAGYATFAETFSGWRSTEADAGALADTAYRRAGLGVAYSDTSTYGVYWVLLLDGADTQ